MFYVYALQDKYTQQIYVGSTRNLTRRKRDHYRMLENNNHHSIKFQDLWNKSESDFQFLILSECQTDEELIIQEQHFIDYYNELGLLLNSSLLADNSMRVPEFRNMISKRNKSSRRNISGINNPNYGNRWTQKMKDEMSSKRRGQCIGSDNSSKRPEVRKKISESKMGMKNPNAKVFKLISPTGEEYIINGGIKRKLKEFGLSYNSFSWSVKQNKGWVSKGWQLSKF